MGLRQIRNEAHAFLNQLIIRADDPDDVLDDDGTLRPVEEIYNLPGVQLVEPESGSVVLPGQLHTIVKLIREADQLLLDKE